MWAVKFPTCCGLRIIGGTDSLSGTDAWNKRDAAKLNKLRTNCVYGFIEDFSTAGVLTITDESKAGFKRAQAELKKQGWKLLGSFPGSHGNYQTYLYGSPEFKCGALAPKVARKRNPR